VSVNEKSDTTLLLPLGNSSVPVWGIDGRERLTRQAKRLGVPVASAVEALPASTDPVVLLRADYVIEENLIADLLRQHPCVLVDPATGLVVGANVSCQSAAELEPRIRSGIDAAALKDAMGGEPIANVAVEDTRYNSTLRRHVTPFLRPISQETRPAIERHLFDLAYKGVTDVVTKFAWPWPAFHVTRFCAAMGISPNMVTTASGVLVLVAYWLFAEGHFGAGLVAAWGMTFLDTVDGKLARVTVTSSVFGNIFDHGIDLIHPPFWYWAWIVGLSASGIGLWESQAIAVIVIGGYVVQRIQEGVFRHSFGVHVHVWRPFDSFFRTITARRNPNLLLLTGFTIAGRPDLGMIAVAVWTVICLGVHMVQIVQALLIRLKGERVRSWLEV